MVCGHDLGPNRPHEYYCARCQHDTPTVFSVSFSLCPSLYLSVRFSFPILLSICTILISLFAFNPHSSATCAKNTRIEVSDCTGSEKSWTERKNIPFETSAYYEVMETVKFYDDKKFTTFQISIRPSFYDSRMSLLLSFI